MNNPQSLQKIFHDSQTSSHGLGISLGRAQPQGPRPPHPFGLVVPHATFSAPSRSQPPSQIDYPVTMRSSSGMQGLREAEGGGQFVQLTPAATKFRAGGAIIAPQAVTSIAQNNIALGNDVLVPLNRHPTLFTKEATPGRKAAELNNVLGNAVSGRLDPKAKVLPSRDKKKAPKRRASASNTPIVSLEQAKSNARVELDLHLDSGVCVEGGYLKGKILVQVRAPTKNQGSLYLGGGKARVIGFEAIVYNDQRNTFYHCSAPMENISPFCHLLYNSEPDEEGFSRSKEGSHILPFAMRLPPRPTKFPVAKGTYESRLNGSSIRYIAMVSIKMKDARTDQRSVAHFYRTIEVWPMFDPKAMLEPSPTPLYATVAKPLFLGGSGTLKLTASLHRAVWIAGQRCHVKVFIANDTEKRTVKALTLSLIRFETVFKPEIVASTPSRKKFSGNDEACRTSTIKRIVARSILEVGEKATKKHATAKGWWTGVEPGAFYEFNHFIILPPFSLTIPRSRLIEVGYSLEVAVSTGPLASDVAVQLPVRIINYISIDPPPSCGPSEKLRNLARAGTRSQSNIPSGEAALSQPVVPYRVVSENARSGILIGKSEPNTGTYHGDPNMHAIGKLEVRNPGPSSFISPVANIAAAAEVWMEDPQKTQELGHALQESNGGLVEPQAHLTGLEDTEVAPQQELQRSSAESFVGDDVFEHASLDDYEEEGLDQIIQSVDPNQFDTEARLETSEMADESNIPTLTTSDCSAEVDTSTLPLSQASPKAVTSSTPIPILPPRPMTVIGIGRSSVKLSSAIRPMKPAFNRDHNVRSSRPFPPRPKPRPILTGKTGKTTILSLERNRMAFAQGKHPPANMMTSDVKAKYVGMWKRHPTRISDEGLTIPLTSQLTDTGEGQLSVSPSEDPIHRQQASMIDVPVSVSALMRQALRTPKTAGCSADTPPFSLNEARTSTKASGDPPNSRVIGRSGELGTCAGSAVVQKPVIGGPLSIKSRIAMFEQGDKTNVITPAIMKPSQTNHASPSVNLVRLSGRRMLELS